MTFILKQIFSLIKLLNSDTGHNQIAAGIAAGFILGMSPIFSLQAIFILGCILFFRIQSGMAFLSAFFFAFIAWILDPLFHWVGSGLLEASSLQGLWTMLYNMPLIPYTRFNNSIVMGAGALAILLSPIIFIVGRILVIQYRSTIVARIKSTKWWKAMQATSIYQWYYSYEKLYGN